MLCFDTGVSYLCYQKSYTLQPNKMLSGDTKHKCFKYSHILPKEA